MSVGPNDCIYLTVGIVEEIHAEAIARFGGLDGVRDCSLLESAVAAPQASTGGESVFADLIEIAAAYLFYLARNHPYLDGNERTALGACLVFLRLNDVSTPSDHASWGHLALAAADGTSDRVETTKRLRTILDDRA